MEAHGATVCGKKQRKIKVTLCIQIKNEDGEWGTTNGGCDSKAKVADDEARAKAVGLCTPGTWKYQTLAGGVAQHYGGGSYIGTDIVGPVTITCHPTI